MQREENSLRFGMGREEKEKEKGGGGKGSILMFLSIPAITLH